MNNEIIRMRKIRDLEEEFDYGPHRIDQDEMTENLVKLNTNMANLYFMQQRNQIDINEFIDKFTENLYIVLDIFNEMGIYPDFFYHEIVKMNEEYQKIANENSIAGQYQIFRRAKLSLKVLEEIRNGLKQGQYRSEAFASTNVNNAYDDMVEFFKEFKIPYDIKTKEQCNRAFTDINYNLESIMNQLSNSDDLFDDVEFLSRLLFEYMTFFVSIGVRPKEYLDKYIEKMSNEQNKEL